MGRINTDKTHGKQTIQNREEISTVNILEDDEGKYQWEGETITFMGSNITDNYHRKQTAQDREEISNINIVDDDEGKYQWEGETKTIKSTTYSYYDTKEFPSLEDILTRTEAEHGSIFIKDQTIKSKVNQRNNRQISRYVKWKEPRSEQEEIKQRYYNNYYEYLNVPSKEWGGRNRSGSTSRYYQDRDEPAEERREICWWHLNNKCKFSEECYYSHKDESEQQFEQPFRQEAQFTWANRDKRM